MSNAGNLSDYLRDQAQLNPDKAVIIHPQQITFSEFDKKVDLLAHGLSEIGIKKGMKVILLATSNAEFYILVFALFRIGSVIVLIDPGVGQHVMKSSLRTIKADAFIGIPSAHLFKLIHHKSFKDISISITVGTRWIWKGHKLSKLYKNTDKPFPSATIDGDELGGIFFTSGSTGPPKGVLYLNRMFHAQIELFRTHYQWSSKEVDLCTFPIIGLFSICLGCTVAIADMNPTQPAKLNPAKVWANLKDYSCTHMFASPMVIRKLAEYAHDHSLKLDSIKRIVTAGAPVPVKLLEDFKKHLPENAKIHTPYGATESLPVTDAEAVELIRITKENPNPEGICVGKAIGDNETLIIPISNQQISKGNEIAELAVNEVGEIAVTGSVVTESYFNPEANLTSKFKDENGRIFHRMGDLGRKDKNGLIWFYGRKNHRVQISGKTLFTIPTEAIFNQHPLVRRSALVGINQQANGIALPVIIIEPASTYKANLKTSFIHELLRLASEHQLTNSINHFLIKKEFPVDPRHNAKIFREKLSLWAQEKIQ